jgi:hypothetical protein
MNKPVISSLIQWLKSTEMFARPSKKLPGKWKLFEYYSEPEGELVNMKENQLNENQFYCEIEFGTHGFLSQKTNLPEQFLEGIETYKWINSKNFIIMIHPEDDGKNEEIQFAIENEILKLLKKDVNGRIIFFGFFRKLQNSATNFS